MRNLFVALLVSCGGFRPSATMTPAVSAKLPVGAEIAVVELGDAAYVFDRSSVSIVRGGKVVARADAPGSRWQNAVTVAAPDGEGRWVVGIAGGGLWRVDPNGGLEEANERLGVADANVLAIDTAGLTSIIGTTGGTVVSTTGSHVMRFSGPDAPVVAAAHDRVAIGSASSIDIYDLASNTKVTYPLPAPAFLGFLDATTDHPRLVVAAAGSVWEEQRGRLERARAPKADRVVISASRLWLLAGSRVYLDAPGGAIAIDAPGGTRIFGSRTGGVWIDHSGDRATRYTLDAPTDDPGWHRTVEPVFQRVCASCHLPDGDADLDLSAPAAWVFRRAEIARRVLVTRTMPPPGTEISDAERQALSSWLIPTR